MDYVESLLINHQWIFRKTPIIETSIVRDYSNSPPACLSSRDVIGGLLLLTGLVAPEVLLYWFSVGYSARA